MNNSITLSSTSRTAASHSSTAGAATNPSSTPSSHSKSDSRLSNGDVAGIVIGVALGLALITFLITFFVMRYRQGSGGQRLQRRSKGLTPLESGSLRRSNKPSNREEPLVAEMSKGPNSYENFLPQSADDKDIKNRVQTLLDHVDLHVENFYRNGRDSETVSREADIENFDSGFLTGSLSTLLSQTKNATPLVKHALAYAVTSAISTTTRSRWSLLPEDFILLPRAIAKSKEATKPAFEQSLSRWRVLTAYLRPDPLRDTSYLKQRDFRIQQLVQSFSVAFAAFRNPKYKDEDRAKSLSAILQEAAELGIWLFSQPCELRFSWPAQRETGSREIATAPGLAKLTDERGQKLVESQPLISAGIQRL